MATAEASRGTGPLPCASPPSRPRRGHALEGVQGVAGVAEVVDEADVKDVSAGVAVRPLLLFRSAFFFPFFLFCVLTASLFFSLSSPFSLCVFCGVLTDSAWTDSGEFFLFLRTFLPLLSFPADAALSQDSFAHAHKRPPFALPPWLPEWPLKSLCLYSKLREKKDIFTEKTALFISKVGTVHSVQSVCVLSKIYAILCAFEWYCHRIKVIKVLLQFLRKSGMALFASGSSTTVFVHPNSKFSNATVFSRLVNAG